MSVTTIALGCLCTKHATMCHRKSRRNRRYCSACIEYCEV